MNGFDWSNMLSLDWQQVSARLSLTLLHFLWQGFAVGVGVAVARYLMQESSAHRRYLMTSIAMFCLPLIAILTFLTVRVPAELASEMETETVSIFRDDVAIPNEIGPFNSDETHVTDQTISPEARSHSEAPSDSSAISLITQPRIQMGIGSVTILERSLRSLYPLAPWLSVFYVFGVALMSLRLLLAMCRVSQLRSRCTPVTEVALSTVIAKLAKQMGLKVAPVACYCEQIAVPAVVGALKPAILLPASLVTNLTPNELGAILSHEMAHIRRFDPVFQLLQKTVESLLFFHPVVWWISRQVSIERENCCDDLAAASGFGNIGYASALLRIAELCIPVHSRKFAGQLTALSADGANRNLLSRRIERQLNMNNMPAVSSRNLPIAVVVLLVFGSISIAAFANSASKAPTDAATNVAKPENAKSRSTNKTNAGNDMSLKNAIASLNLENKQLERGLDQPPLTTDEVLTAIQQSQWKKDSGRLNEAEFATLKAVAESGQLPDSAYFSVYTQQQTETFTVQHFWRVQLFLPAIGHDGFVPFTIRDTTFPDEKIDPVTIAWGDADVDGLSLGAYLSPKKDTYQFGERIRLRLFVRNNGTEPVESTWRNLTEPGPGALIVVNESGDKIPVHLGHDKWLMSTICGSIGGQLTSGATHAFNVPFEIRVGGVDTINTNKLVGAIIDAKPGQKLQLKVRSTNGSNRTRTADDPSEETGIINFDVAEIPATQRDSASNGMDDAESKIPLDRVVWWDAGDGLESGFLLTSPEPPNQRIPMNSVAEYKILVRNKSDKEITFLARLVPHEMADAPYLIPSDQLSKEISRGNEVERLPEEFRAEDGPSRNIEPEYAITLAPGESAIIPNQNGRDDLGLYVGDQGDGNFPKVIATNPGMNWVVQPLQLQIPPPTGGTQMLGRYVLTKVDRAGTTREEPAVRRVAEPDGKTVYPRIQLDVGTLNAAATRNAQFALWGEVDKGLQCGIRLLNSKTSYQIGDILEAEILWRNTGDTTINTPLPQKLDLYPSINDAEGRFLTIDFGGRVDFIPGSYDFKSGEIRSLGVTEIKIVAEGTPSPESNMEPGHITLAPGIYKLSGSGGVSGANTGNPTSGEIEFTVNRTNMDREKEDANDTVSISGQVIGVDGKPLAGLPISVDYITTRTATVNAQRLVSDADGKFVAHGLPKDARLFVRYSRWPGREDPCDPSVNYAIVELAAADAAARDEIRLDLSKSNCTLTGKLVNKDGTGVADAEISANYGPASTRLNLSQRTKTGPGGTFKITGLPPGSFVVSSGINHDKRGERLTIELKPGGTTNVSLHDFLTGAPQTQRDVEPAWGKKYDNGLQAGIFVDPQRDQYKVGEVIQVRLVVRNSGDQPGHISHASARDRLHVSITRQAENTNGENRVEVFDYSRFTGWVSTTDYLIKSGQEVEVGSFSIHLKRAVDARQHDAFFGLNIDGQSEIKMVATLGDGLNRMNPLSPRTMPGETHSVPTTGQFKIEIGELP